MYRSILVPLDGSSMAEHGLIPAADIARRAGGALALVVVHPIGSPEDAPIAGSRADQELRADEDTYLARLRDRVASFGVATTIAVLGGGDVVPALAEHARAHAVDLVVGATHGRGTLARFLLGGTALRLAHALRCPMLLLKPLRSGSRELPATGPHRIAVCLDGSARAETALEAALALSAGPGLSCLLLRAVHLPQPTRTLFELRRVSEQYLARVAERLESRGIHATCRTILSGNPGETLLISATRWGADLLALTTRERSEGERTLLGSVADHLVRKAAVPVLVCHAALESATVAGPGLAPAAAGTSHAHSSGDS